MPALLLADVTEPWPESRLGQGTCFRIYLPRIAQSAAEEGEGAGTGKPETQNRNLGTVLLVEDEDAVRRLAARVLSRGGYTVVEAASGREALQRLAEQPTEAGIDLLLTDVVMPGIGGWELSKAVRERHPEIPVLFMSGYTADDVVRRGVQDDDVPFIQKPFLPADLLRRVGEVLETRGGGKEKSG